MKLNEKISIFYFSSTGNSLKAAMDIVDNYIEYELINIANSQKRLTDNRIVGFVFPVFMGTLPKLVENYFLNFPFKKDTYYFAIGTYYTYRGVTLSVVSKIFRDKGVGLNYANCIPSVGNCLKEYKVPLEKRQVILKRTEDKTKIVIEEISRKVEKLPSKYCKLLVQLHEKLFDLFFKKTYLQFSVENSCINCGVCSKVCPVNNISFENKLPKWGQDCISCHACVHWCPKNVINIGKSKGRPQYLNPNINLRTFMKFK